ncbi:MAG: outer membrane protein assembly factor BamB [Verrucomicrobiales bacterium]|jgi:outer membrane protein assembly factor BamB
MKPNSFPISALASLGILISSAFAADWPGWRGADRTGISAEKGLLTEWPEEGPPLLWQTDGCGKGFSSIAVADGRIFTLGRPEGKDGECLIAKSEKDGNVLWTTAFGTSGESNGTPVVDGDRVYGVGKDGDLVCCNVATGDKLWSKRFDKDFGGKMMSGWGYSECPLVDDDRLLCTPGSKEAMIVALDKLTGKEIWRSAMPKELGDRGKDGAGYSSIVISTGGGVKQYVQLTGRGLVSIRASDGKYLWHYNAVANDTANISTPIVSGDHVFCSTGYGTGSALLKLSKEGNGIKAEEQYFLKSQKLQNHHGGMVLIDGHIYCGHKHNEGFPICVRMEDGEVAWGGKTRGEGKGSAAVVAADGHLIFRYQSGEVVLIEATKEAYRIKGSFKPAFKDRESWAHPVVANGRLYLREQDKLMCYDLRKS